MRNTLKNTLTALATACACSSVQANWIDTVLTTLPGGIVNESTDFWSQQWEGMKYIFNNGVDGVVVGIRTEHPRWDYDNRSEENGWPYGGGLVRTVTDENNNERSLFAFAFSDSHYYVEPFVGYTWVKRFPVGDTFHLGAGYILGITTREDFNWIPCPAPLPLVKVGTDAVGLYATYIPFTNVFFMFGIVRTDALENRLFPTTSTSPFRHTTEVYGAWMRVTTDSATERAYTVSSDPGMLLGIRHFFGTNWAIDLTYSESDHDTFDHGVKHRSFEHTAYTAALQYHINLSKSFRMHAGAGIGYSTWEQKGGPIDESSVFPVLQAGATYAVTDHFRLMAGINVLYPKFDKVAPDGDVAFRPHPAQMYVGAGFAF